LRARSDLRETSLSAIMVTYVISLARLLQDQKRD
jgi:hypothetical protein